MKTREPLRQEGPSSARQLGSIRGPSAAASRLQIGCFGAQLYACPRSGCQRVVPALYQVQYGRGLEAFDPSWMCDECLAVLREDERAICSETSTMDLAWGVTVLSQKGTAVEAQLGIAA